MEINQIRSTSGSHEDKRHSSWFLNLLWGAAATALLVSLFVVERGGEAGYIYLRATGILYLSLTLKEENIIPRGIRVGVGCLMIILALDATVPVVENLPLYICTGLLIIHIVLSILTYPSADLMSITGLRGTAFILLGVTCSTLSTVIGFTVTFDTGIAIARDISFALTGVPILFLANGVPITEKDQLVGSFACLVPIAGAMYLAGGIYSIHVWLLLATGMISGLASSVLCVSTTSTWRASLMQMWNYLVSGKTTAFFIVIVLTFANIACVNGKSLSVEGSTCVSETEPYNYTCVDGIGSTNLYKTTEQAIPLIMMGLAKGPLVVLVLLPQQTNLGEMNAWAMSTVLATAALILFGIEGRGRCLFVPTADCKMDRSQGFLSGVGIGAICTFVCFCRCIYCGYILPWKVNKIREGLEGGLETRRRRAEGATCASDCYGRMVCVLSNKEIPTALAIGALLICLISTSSSYLSLSAVQGNNTIFELDKAAGQKAVTVLAHNLASETNLSQTSLYTNIMRSYITPCYPNVSGPECLLGPHTSTFSVIGRRMIGLEEYWRTTAWSISGAILAMSFLIVEIMPGSPSVAISIMAGLLLTAGRIHYGCLISSLNDRLTPVGVRINSSVDLNVYIISTISIVVGLAWGGAIVSAEMKRKTNLSLNRRESVNPTRVQLTVCRTSPNHQSFREMYEVLREAGLINYMIQGQLIRNWARDGVSAGSCTWDVIGNCDLSDGIYIIENTADELIMMAQACSNSIGVLALLKRVEPVRVPVLIEDIKTA